MCSVNFFCANLCTYFSIDLCTALYVYYAQFMHIFEQLLPVKYMLNTGADVPQGHPCLLELPVSDRTN